MDKNKEEIQYIPRSESIGKEYLDKIREILKRYEVSPLNRKFENFFNPNSKKPGSSSMEDESSKAGITNVLTGTLQVLKSNPFKNTLNESTNYKGNKMEINIRDFILEEGLTQAIQNNASKISGGLLLGAGAAAMHAANGGDFGMGNNESTPKETGFKSAADAMQSDIDKNKTVTRTTDVTNNSLFGKLGEYVQDRGQANKVGNMQDAMNDYNEAKNSSGNFLSTGEKVGLGAAGAAGLAGAMAMKAKRR